MHFCTSLGEKEPEDEQYGVFVRYRLTTLAKLFVDVSDVVSQKLSRNGVS